MSNKLSCQECESSLAMITKCYVPKCVLFAAQVQIPPPPGTKINISRRSSEERNKSKNTRKHHKCAYSWPKKNFECLPFLEHLHNLQGERFLTRVHGIMVARSGRVRNEDEQFYSLSSLKHESNRVEEPFFCCEEECRRFERDALLQLGYNANAEAILFVPELVDAMLAIPAQGWKTSLETARKLKPLDVPVSKRDASPTQ